MPELETWGNNNVEALEHELVLTSLEALQPLLTDGYPHTLHNDQRD